MVKIRSDFVTNSSSFSSVVIRIQSKELAEMLAKYRELFFDNVQILPDEILVDVEELADEWGDAPQSLEKLLDKLLAGLKGQIWQEFWNEPLDRQIEEEFKANKQELTDSIQSAEWDFHNYDRNEFEGIGRKRFVYHRDEGGSGTYWEEPFSDKEF